MVGYNKFLLKFAERWPVTFNRERLAQTEQAILASKIKPDRLHKLLSKIMRDQFPPIHEEFEKLLRQGCLPELPDPVAERRAADFNCDVCGNVGVVKTSQPSAAHALKTCTCVFGTKAEFWEIPRYNPKTETAQRLPMIDFIPGTDVTCDELTTRFAVRMKLAEEFWRNETELCVIHGDIERVV
jgi:hypothetical protein